VLQNERLAVRVQGQQLRLRAAADELEQVRASNADATERARLHDTRLATAEREREAAVQESAKMRVELQTHQVR